MTPNADNDNISRPAWYDQKMLQFAPLIRRISIMYSARYDREEFEQDLFLEICRKWSKYNDEYKFGTWVGLCARNVASAHRQKKNSVKRSGRQIEITATTPIIAPATQEASSDLRTVMDSMSGNKKTEALLRIASGELLREIAADYGVGKERVRQIAEEERKAIRQRLGIARGEAA